MPRRSNAGCRALLFLVLPVLGHGATCPWLNAATAGGILGGVATPAVTRETANRDDAVCTFTHERSQLRVEVMTMDTPHTEFTSHSAQCSVNQEPLKAIGNEAVVCGGRGSAQVVGRVRTRIFVILLTATGPSEQLREKAREVAESVAGNLF